MKKTFSGSDAAKLIHQGMSYIELAPHIPFRSVTAQPGEPDRLGLFVANTKGKVTHVNTLAEIIGSPTSRRTNEYAYGWSYNALMRVGDIAVTAVTTSLDTTQNPIPPSGALSDGIHRMLDFTSTVPVPLRSAAITFSPDGQQAHSRLEAACDTPDDLERLRALLAHGDYRQAFNRGLEGAANNWSFLLDPLGATSVALSVEGAYTPVTV
ncbi:MAG TPA: hypothetical protein VMY99_03710 [Nevskiaceae bacterium]|nr:hypothetical protein [Nevskiaceae bacterium]